ncbi:MAG: type II toxin-antitoxin system VapC family toxin [Verrucomicrobiota bacterium]
MISYADTNFFTRLYLELAESPDTDRLFASLQKGEASPLPITWLHRVEIINAFQLHVFFKCAPGQIFVSPEQAALAQANFQSDLAEKNFLCHALVPVGELERQFEELALRHTARHGFRTYDLLHVASALVLKCDTFWSFDPKASKLAALEGLKIRKI